MEEQVTETEEQTTDTEVFEYEPRRRARIVIAPNIFLEIMTTGWRGDGVTCIQGLPEGARFIHLIYEAEYDLFCLVVEHDSFDPVPACERLPIFHPVYFSRRERAE